jgi:hypothetical protein
LNSILRIISFHGELPVVPVVAMDAFVKHASAEDMRQVERIYYPSRMVMIRSIDPLSRFRSQRGPRFTHDSTRSSVAGGLLICHEPGFVAALLRRTDLPSTVLEKFESGVFTPKGSSLPAVELSEDTLTQIGYFILASSPFLCLYTP